MAFSMSKRSASICILLLTHLGEEIILGDKPHVQNSGHCSIGLNPNHLSCPYHLSCPNHLSCQKGRVEVVYVVSLLGGCSCMFYL